MPFFFFPFKTSYSNIKSKYYKSNKLNYIHKFLAIFIFIDPHNMSLNKKEFYGGAITGSLPSFFIDASQFREIPDTQEVFVINDDPPSILKSHNNNEDNKSVIPIRIDKNDSLIIDIMERVDVNNDVESVKVHFEDIAIKNDVEGEWNILKLDKVKVPSLEYAYITNIIII